MSLAELTRKPARDVLDLRFDRTLPTLYAAAAFAALWLLGRRYHGIIHDATLYVTMGLHRLEPQAFARDLFFVNGSQDSYSVFSPLYAPLIALLGPADAALLVVIVGQVAFIGAAWALAGRLAPGTRWWALVMLAALSGYYGGGHAVRIAESFATARTLAEPLVLATFAALLAGRTAFALLALAAASLLHPLVALPAWGVLALWYAQERPHLLRLLPLALIGGGATLLLLPPKVDPAWHESLVERSRHLFVLLWPLADFAKVAWAAGVTALAVAFAAPAARRLLLAVVAVGVAGVLASAVLVDFARSGPASALQFWRALWILQAVSTLMVPFVVMKLWNGAPGHRLAAGFVAASCCFGRGEQGIAAALVLGALALTWSVSLAGRIDARRMRIGLVVSACVAAVGMLYDVQRRLPDLYMPLDEPLTAYFRVAGSLGVLLPLAALLGFGMQSRYRRAACVASLLACAFAVAIWDARSPWSRYLEQRPTHPFSSAIPKGAQVYWSTVSSPAWTALRTTNWFSADQGAGIVFTRATAIEWPQREVASRPLREAEKVCELLKRPDCTIPAAPVRALCSFPQGPDYLVLSAPVAGWRALGLDPFGKGQALRLYACRDAA
jgi:hypothetical protein